MLGVLGLVAVNLVLILLFPPFEYFSAITKAALPTFEGFYFLFGDNSQRQLITAILYIEVALVVINGGPSGNGMARPDALVELAAELGISDLMRFEPPSMRKQSRSNCQIHLEPSFSRFRLSSSKWRLSSA